MYIVNNEYIRHDIMYAGGVAGGDKYLVNDILFKLTVDPMLGNGRHLYGGAEGAMYYLAAKAAAHGDNCVECLIS